VPWPDSFADRATFFEAYESALAGTTQFTRTAPADTEQTVTADPRSLLIFRLLMATRSRS
jgi:hypothetical protein